VVPGLWRSIWGLGSFGVGSASSGPAAQLVYFSYSDDERITRAL
jgi:hypothetical protein